jgi:uncharacterized membrane protein
MGIYFAFLSALLITAKDGVSKKLSSSVDGTLSTFASFVYALPFYFVLLLVLWLLGLEDFQITGGFFALVLLRSLSDALAEWCKMTSFSYGDLSTVSPYLSLSSLFLLPLAPVLTGDRITWVGSVGVLLILLGTVLGTITNGRKSQNKQEPERDHKKAILFAIGFSLFAAVNTCLDRLAVHQASPTLSGFLMTVFAAAPFLPAILRHHSRKRDLIVHWRPFTVRGLFEITFMVFKLYALKTLEAAYVVAIQRSSILFSIISGHVLFNERHFRERLIVGALVLSGVVLILWQ